MKHFLLAYTYRITSVLVIILGVAFLLHSCSNRPSARIRGNIVDLPDSRIYMSVYNNYLQIIDSTTSLNGRFTLNIPDILPDVVFISFEKSPGDQIPVLVEGGGEDVFISGDLNYNEDINIYGTAANDDLWKYRQSVKRYDIMLKAVELSIGEYHIKLKEEKNQVDSLIYSSLINKRDSINGLVYSSQSRFIKENPASIVSALLAFNTNVGKRDRVRTNLLIQQLDTVNMPDNAFLRRLRRERNQQPQEHYIRR